VRTVTRGMTGGDAISKQHWATHAIRTISGLY